MKGTVRVVAKSHRVPSAKADAKALKAQVASALKTAKALAKTTVAPGNVSLGASGQGRRGVLRDVPGDADGPGGDDAEVLDVGQVLRGPHGDVRSRRPRDQPTSYLGDLVSALRKRPGVTLPGGVSERSAAGRSASLSPTLHGNGFWNSGAARRSTATPLPNSNAVKFTAPGTYKFYCLIHPFMKGTVIVQ